MSKTELFVANCNRLIEDGAISISEISRRSGIPRAEISRLLNRKRTSCTIDRAEKIASALGLPLAELVDGPLRVTAT